MFYILILLMFITFFKALNADYRCRTFLSIANVVLGIIMIIFVAVANKLSFKINIDDTQTYKVSAYDEYKSLLRDDKDNITIFFKTAKGSFKIEPDEKIEIITETVNPTDVTIEESQYLNLVWLYPETRYTYTFSNVVE